MGRRKKEPESVHRENISSAAERLFSNSGIESTTMDQIAREAGYSKATLYVYFTSKEELIGFLVQKSMEMLLDFIRRAIHEGAGTRDKYDGICRALARYQELYPLYFSLALGEINVDFDKADYPLVEKETYETGEKINDEIIQFISSGIDAGELLPDMPVRQTVFLFWASLSGLVQMAANKRSYIEKAMGQTREQFLEYGFDRLYRIIRAEEKR